MSSEEVKNNLINTNRTIKNRRTVRNHEDFKVDIVSAFYNHLILRVFEANSEIFSVEDVLG